jgi:hypothetical protein
MLNPFQEPLFQPEEPAMSSAFGIAHRRHLATLAILLLTFVLAAGCNEESTRPQDDELVLPTLTSPENVISAMQILYNDKTHGDSDRLAGYASLFDSAFVFHFQPADVNIGLPASWNLDAELDAHAAIFGAQAARNIYSLELRVIHDPAEELTPAEIGREDWQEIFATNVYLRVMFNPQDGLEVNGGQAEFKFPPAKNGQFKIGDWADLPRPGLVRGASVENNTWGGIKASFN